MAEIGATLREARMRAHIDVSEIEAQTKIRAKYLRALENEEWDLLPGPTFVKSFLRTYANALGLDGKILVEEYRLTQERPSEADFQPIVSSQRRTNSRRKGARGTEPSRGYKIAIGAVCLVILLLVVLLLTGGSPKHTTHTKAEHTISSIGQVHRRTSTHASLSPARRASLALQATGAVYVCLIGDDGRKVIPGVELKAGQRTATHHARRFELTLGNNAVMMYVNGKALRVPASSQPIGYSISPSGRHTLSSGQLPTCE
jgi:cytoskeletal protein RodZ